MAPLIPLLVGAGVVGRTAMDLYQGYTNTRRISKYEKQYYEQYNKEVAKFYSDYQKNTGVTVRYPYRSGAIPNLSSLYRASWNASNWYFGAFRTGYSGGLNTATSYASYLYR